MGARLPDTDTLISMGFDPSKVDKLCKYFSGFGAMSANKEAIKKILRKTDRQQFINRFVWQNLPNGLTGDIIERILYYKYRGIFFFVEALGEFKFLPFANAGTIDEIGRYTKATPLPFNGKTEVKDKVFIPGLELRTIYDIEKAEGYIDVDGKEVDPFLECGVVLNSYCKDMSQTLLPEQMLIDPILDMMAEAIPMARTNLLANSGIKGWRVDNENDQANVMSANEQITDSALNGKPFIPIVGKIDYQELTPGGAMQADQYLMYMQSLDNFRLSAYGLSNNGLFEKKGAYVNDATMGNVQANVGQVFQDALTQRQEFCDMVNAIWGLGISCEASETVIESDRNMDGEIDDNADQSGVPGNQVEGSVDNGGND